MKVALGALGLIVPAFQLMQPITQAGRLFEIQVLGRLVHRFSEFFHQSRTVFWTHVLSDIAGLVICQLRI